MSKISVNAFKFANLLNLNGTNVNALFPSCNITCACMHLQIDAYTCFVKGVAPEVLNYDSRILKAWIGHGYGMAWHGYGMAWHGMT